MQRFSRLDEYVNRFADALLKDEYRVCALKKLISMNLTSETYRRFEIRECVSLLLQAGSCTELCKQLLQKIKKVAQEERGCRKRAREMSSSSEENEEPIGKKMKEGSQIEQYVDQLTDALVDDEKNREFALKKLFSLNLSTEIYERFEVGKLASVLIEAGICTKLCQQLLDKIKNLARSMKKRSKFARRRELCQMRRKSWKYHKKPKRFLEDQRDKECQRRSGRTHKYIIAK